MNPTGSSVLAIEWDRTELRYVWANCTARSPIVRSMGRLPVEAWERWSELEPLLGELKQELRIKRAKVVACLSRSEIDEFEATLPPAAADELGALVAHEAHKHYPNIADDARVDFLTIEENVDQTRRMSVVVLSAARHQELVKLCDDQGWKLAGIQLRHIATTRLLAKQVELASQDRSILLSLSRTDADLVILDHEQIALVRTIHLSSELNAASLIEKLTVEIQRSLTITTKPDHHEDLGRVQLYLFGRADEQQALSEQLAGGLNLPVRVLDPLVPFTTSRRKLPEHAHQFAALLGSLLDQPRERTIDLHAPKCVRKAPTWRTRAIVYGAAAALGMILAIGWMAKDLTQARMATAQLKAESGRLQKQIADVESKLAVVDFYDGWIRDDVNWLDELRQLSLGFPDRENVQVKSMTISAGTNSDGLIAMNLRAKDHASIARLEQSVRAEGHQIRINQLSQNEGDKEFPWQFGATVLVRRRDREEFRAFPSTAPPPSAAPAAEASGLGEPRSRP
jgi:Tfp pilus assembly PilM family ATPase